MKFSANLGFLWQQLSLCDAIVVAHKAGFDAVECHWPYEVSSQDVRAVLVDTGLAMVSINTSPGNLGKDDFGLSALPGRQTEAQLAIDRAIDYANKIQCPYIHVMAGKTDVTNEAQLTFSQNLTYACEQAQKNGIIILIEPINHYDVPNYYLTTLEQATQTLNRVGWPNLKILFDCYHMSKMQVDIVTSFEIHKKDIAHIQIASIPDRAEPDTGSLDYKSLLNEIHQIGYKGYVGAEYRPRTTTAEGLDWLKSFKGL